MIWVNLDGPRPRKSVYRQVGAIGDDGAETEGESVTLAVGTVNG